MGEENEVWNGPDLASGLGSSAHASGLGRPPGTSGQSFTPKIPNRLAPFPFPSHKTCTIMLQITNLTPASFIEGAEPVEIQRPRKRQRKVLSCDSCHKQKVKCDRQQPCSRCIAGNRREQCCYTGRDSSPAEGTHDVPTQQSSPATSDATLPSKAVNPPITTVWRKGRARFSGLTHWAQLAVKVRLSSM